MKYQIKGSVEIRFPEEVSFTVEGESKEEAVINLIKTLIDNEELGQYFFLDYTKATRINKVYKVRVTETFVNEITLSTEDYPDLEDEYDVEKYVRNNIEDFEDQIDHSEWELDNREAEVTECNDDIEEE